MSSRTLRRVLSIVILIALLIPPFPVGAVKPDVSPPQSADAQQPAAQAGAVDRPASPPPGCFWADLNCDHLVDVFDFVAIAQGWNCSLGDGCFVPEYDVDGDDRVGVSDIMKVTVEFDPDPMQFSVASPANGQVIGGATVHVSGTASDRHPVTVTVNGQNAPVANGQFSLDLPVQPGNQVITVVATNVLETASEQRQVAVDAAGPQIEVIEPKDGQAVYTTTPAVDIRYSDYDSQVNTSSLVVSVQPAGGSPINITGSLTVQPDRAYGTAPALQQDTPYTLTVRLRDTLANETVLATTFYVPLDPGGITPPAEPPEAAWVSGFVYDSTSCDEYLTTCQGLAGAQVTLAAVDMVALEAVRTARQDEIMARVAREGPFEPLPPMADAGVTTALPGTVITGPDGFFAFPVADTGMYWLRVEKEGYTCGQREAEIVKERSTATNAIYLTPIDPAVTPCGAAGCSHTSSDGMLQVVIPPGAIPAGETLDVTATNLTQVEYLPSGELPPGTWETYAFNLGGNLDVTFLQPVTIRSRNTIGFGPGVVIPLGYWNEATYQWEHSGIGIVDTTGQWVEGTVTHFSYSDWNPPVSIGHALPKTTDNDEDGKCGDEAGEAACFISLKSGILSEDVMLPDVDVSGQNIAPTLLYNSRRAQPSAVIDIELSIDRDPTVILGNYIRFELFIEGRKFDSLYFENSLQTSEVGRFRYLWDGKDAQGNRMPPGVYAYRVLLRIPYRAQYCRAIGDIFGNPPDCTRPLGIFVTADVIHNDLGTVILDLGNSTWLGTGWVLDDMQHLYQDAAGRIMITSGREQRAEYYFRAKDQRYQPMAGATQGEVEFAGHQNDQFTNDSLPGGVRDNATSPLQDTDDADNGVDQFVASEITSPVSVDRATALRPFHSDLDQPEQPGILTAITPVEASAAVSTSTTVVADATTPNTNVCGTISTNTTWTLAGSPYVLTCSVVIANGITLTVEPGVTVGAGSNAEFKVQVGGHLDAIGTAEQPIVFTSITDSSAVLWSGFEILGTTHMRYVNERFGFSRGMFVYNVQAGVVRIESSQFTNNGGAAFRIDNSRVVISDTVVSNNPGIGVTVQGAADVVIHDSQFQNNTMLGLQVTGGHVQVDDSAVVQNCSSTSCVGAVSVDGATSVLTVTNSIFQDNQGYPLMTR